MKITKEELTEQTHQHIKDVCFLGGFLLGYIQNNLVMHDNTKLNDDFEATDEFTEYLNSDFKTDWFEMHKSSEAHHLQTDNLTLIDFLEHIVDCIAACYRRSGLENYKRVEIDHDKLAEMIKNTEDLLIRCINNNKELMEV